MKRSLTSLNRLIALNFNFTESSILSRISHSAACIALVLQKPVGDTIRFQSGWCATQSFAYNNDAAHIVNLPSETIPIVGISAALCLLRIGCNGSLIQGHFA
mmetsp:Transcript_6329/g.13097  ORF Transcript_6329/g.13097 Transcript_6329/m.13097 type:complete len:102 (-) Transcript_6329:1673-1978(-)